MASDFWKSLIEDMDDDPFSSNSKPEGSSRRVFRIGGLKLKTIDKFLISIGKS